MTSVFNYFSFDKKKNAVPLQEKPGRALPASWYTAPEMFEFERRAIFSNRWLFMTSISRIKSPGDWLRYQFAGFDIIITRDRQNNVNSFHNTCRHRAYPVIEKEGSGNAKILACRYHGWSYGLNGNLAKAPGYQELEFNKTQNGLFRIHTKIDKNGFIWINMDSKDTPDVPWEQHFDQVDVQARYEGLDFNNYELDHEYKLETNYNWKIASDNFNECYHCPTTHPDIPNFLNLDSFDSDLKDGHIQHNCKPTQEQVDLGVNVHSTYYFPNVSMTVGKHFLMIQKFLPHAANSSTMAYEIYKNRNSTDEEFHLISDMYERVMREDKVLCENAQKNLHRGVFNSGLLHPTYEKAPLFFQQTVRKVVTDHFKREKAEGREIWPARRDVVGEIQDNVEDEKICAELSCKTQNEALAW